MKIKRIGACHTIIKEPILLDMDYPVRWQEPRVDLRELANLRYVHKWSRKQLASHYGRTEDAIQNYFQKIKKKGILPD
jgi:hypothetical protein